MQEMLSVLLSASRQDVSFPSLETISLDLQPGKQQRDHKQTLLQ